MKYSVSLCLVPSIKEGPEEGKTMCRETTSRGLSPLCGAHCMETEKVQAVLHTGIRSICDSALGYPNGATQGNQLYLSPFMISYRAVVKGLAYFCDLESYTNGSFMLLAGPPMSVWSKGRSQTKEKSTKTAALRSHWFGKGYRLQEITCRHL